MTTFFKFLARYGIVVRGFSSDGDPRLLSAMRHQMKFKSERTCYMQDATHAGLKLRTCFLRPFAALPIGTKLASVAHLKVLIRSVPKSVHGLVLSDVSPVDRQNFKSLEKCMSIRTCDALRRYVPDSEATEFFLRLCSEITSSLMDMDITPYERIEMIFHSIFFLRIWRKWIIQSKYNLRENFITSNAYECAELNAANLLKLIRMFRDEKTPELFLTTLFDSQACERAFRQFRSMGTPNYTKINFTLYELLHMIRRLEVQNEILYSKLSDLDIRFPKLEKKRKTTKIFALPTEEEINECLNRAKRFAINDASKFGMHVNPEEIDHAETYYSNRLETDDEMDECYDDDDDDESGIEIHSREDLDNHGILDDENDTGDEDLPRSFLIMTDHLGNKKSIRKSTFVWLLSEGVNRISSDRLVRVQQKEEPSNPATVEPLEQSIVFVSKVLSIGDWCIFKLRNDDVEMVHIGLIHAFRVANKKLFKDKKYRYDSVNLIDKPNIELEVLSTWYFINDKAGLEPANIESHSFVGLNNYVATVSMGPKTDPDTRNLFFDENEFNEIKNGILRLIH